MRKTDKIWIAQGRQQQPLYLLPKMANRHGLIAGATGTGKTITLQVMAESFSDMGVPVLITDIKGDLAGLAQKGGQLPQIQDRLNLLNIEEFDHRSYPVRFWDVFGEAGHPIRTTISEMGPLLLARLLALNETQTGVLNMIFRIADDQNLLLADMKDLIAMIQYVGGQAKELSAQYGSISAQSIGAILRRLAILEDQGAEYFFGEPALDIFDWLQTTAEGRGYIQIMHCAKLVQLPLLYSTFILWLLSELFESLPEAGDLDRPKLVLFLDEAHLLFENTSAVLIQKIEQVVRMIRSKGIGIFFITQHPADLTENVLSQLGNRVQHALRAYTPAERRKLKAAAQAFRSNPNLDTETALTELATGEALISFLDADGSPSVVERAWILPPRSHPGSIMDTERRQILASSLLSGKYDQLYDRESAYELLQAKRELEQAELQAAADRKLAEQAERSAERNRSTRGRARQQSLLEKAAHSALTTIGRELGRAIVRGILGSLKKQ